jgi:CYTH domain-containing protein
MVDTFINADGSPSLLRIETTKQEKEIKIPPFVKVLKEVTADTFYSSKSMAMADYKMPAADKKEIFK